MAERGSPSPAVATGELRPVLGLFDSTMIVMGCIIGSGIFRTPRDVAANMHTTGGVLFLWMLGGVVAITGALVFAELGAMLPQAGGEYVFLRRGFGRFVAFFFGWCLLAAIVSSAVAFIARVFVDHLDAVLGGEQQFGEGASRAISLVLILLLTALNVRGVRLGAVTQNLIMVTKIAGMVGVILLGFWAAFRGTEPELPAVATGAPAGSFELGAAGAALLSVVFSYGGFQNVSAAAAEIKNPQRTVPLSILVGTVGVIALYVALNWSLVTILGVEGVARSATPVADAAGAVLPQGRFWVALLILCSTFGITQVLLMVTPRIYYAMSRDGLFFPAVGAVHPRYGTPHVAIALQAGFSILHLFLGEHLNLLQVTTLLDWVFFGLCGVAFFRLRWTAPELPRPYRAFGYPVLPACFLLLCVTIVVNAVLNAERVAVWRAGVIAAVGVVLFLVSQRSGPGRTA